MSVYVVEVFDYPVPVSECDRGLSNDVGDRDIILSCRSIAGGA